MNSNWSYSPETLNLGQIRRFLEPYLEIWRMTLENKRAHLLCYFKLCASFHHHIWIQTGVTVRKRLSWALTSVTLNKLQWNLNRKIYIFSQENAFDNVVWKMAPFSVLLALCEENLPGIFVSNRAFLCQTMHFAVEPGFFVSNECYNVKQSLARFSRKWRFLNNGHRSLHVFP